MNVLVLTKLALVLSLAASTAQTSLNWRGPQRMGTYNESGLMREWPAGGPEVAWTFEQLGKGFSSPVIANDRIYLSGMEGETGFIYILTMSGRLEKKFPYGAEFYQSYPGSRSTPAVVGNLIYIVSGHGLLVCIDGNNGEIVWQQDLFNDFDGRNIRWGITENLLVDGDRIYCAPGGKKYNIVALNRHDGELVWRSGGTGEVSAYSSPLLVNHYGRSILITMMQNHVVALDANSGRVMWSHPHRNRWDVHPNTPIYHGGNIFAFSGYGQGGVKLKLDSVGDLAGVEWTNSDLDNQIGGAVLVDGYIYGAGDRNRFWFCLDWETGETIYSARDIAKGTVIYADGRLYCYSDRGELALVEPTPEGFNIKGQTDITLGSDQHWAHLVINNGILYLRHGNALMAFDIKQ